MSYKALILTFATWLFEWKGWNTHQRGSLDFRLTSVAQKRLCLSSLFNKLLAGNLKKYQVLNLGFIQNDSNICVNDVEIETKDNIKLLGVVLDSRLNFSEQIISICKKASQRIDVLMRLRNLIPMKSKLILFKSAILPYLTYCHLVWHFCKASDTRKLEDYKKEDLGRFSRTIIQVMNNY